MGCQVSRGIERPFFDETPLHSNLANNFPSDGHRISTNAYHCSPVPKTASNLIGTYTATMASTRTTSAMAPTRTTSAMAPTRAAVTVSPAGAAGAKFKSAATGAVSAAAVTASVVSMTSTSAVPTVMSGEPEIAAATVEAPHGRGRGSSGSSGGRGRNLSHSQEREIRMAAWECGKPDYMGLDSFENILAKLNQSMGMPAPTAPTRQDHRKSGDVMGDMMRREQV